MTEVTGVDRDISTSVPDLPGETNDWDSWLGQSAVTKASDKSCVNKLF